MAHAPRRFVAPAKLALKFLGGNAVARGGEQIDRVEPLLQRCMGAIEERARHGVNMLAAVAGVGGKLPQLVPVADLAAARTGKIRAVAELEEMRETRIVIGKHRHELLNGDRLGHGSTPSSGADPSLSLYVCQPDNRPDEYCGLRTPAVA